MRKCKGCGSIKDEDEFYKCASNTSGLTGKCKDCIKAQSRISKRKRYVENLEAARERGRRYYWEGGGRELAKARNATKEKRDAKLSTKKQYIERYPEKFDAQRAVMKAVMSGELTKGPCEVCGETKDVDGHHDDYGKKLDVKWLCRPCHGRVHRDTKAYNARSPQ